MAKAEALAIIDTRLAGKSHAELNADPGVNLPEVIEELRAEIDEIVEA